MYLFLANQIFFLALNRHYYYTIMIRKVVKTLERVESSTLIIKPNYLLEYRLKIIMGLKWTPEGHPF